MRRLRYPGVSEAERERSTWKKKAAYEDTEPDFIGGAPNYEKWPDMTPEEVLVMLNID